MSTLESQVTSKDTEIAAETMQWSNLEGRVKLAEDGYRPCCRLSKSSRPIYLTPRWCVLRFPVLCVRQRAGLTVNASETSLREEVARLQSDSSRLHDQCKLAFSLGGRVRDLLDSVRKENRTLSESVSSLGVHYDQKLATFVMSGTGCRRA